MNIADLIVEDDASVSTTAPDTATTADDEGALPAKFRGKSRAQIAEMYSNLEKHSGGLANELGIQRQLTDRILGLKRVTDLSANSETSGEKPPKPLTVDEFVDDPQQSIERVVRASVERALEPIRQETAQSKVASAKQQFEQKHPGYRDTVQDPEFVEWVSSSPLRKRIFAVANSNNWEVADELFNEYEASRGGSTNDGADDSATGNGRVGGRQSLRRSVLTSGGSAAGEDTMRARGKVFKRAELMKLRINNPDAYYDDDFQEEVRAAYAEGRVR